MGSEKSRCVYCEADLADTLDEAARRLARCNNCAVDISLRGQWSGDGVAILRALAAKYGAKETADAYERALADRQARDARKGGA